MYSYQSATKIDPSKFPIPIAQSVMTIDPSKFPLPIAYELKQFKGIAPEHLKGRCRQLNRTFESAIRYCAVIALSEYRQLVLKYQFRSADLDALIVDNIDWPTVDVCIDFVESIMQFVRNAKDRLVVPDLLDFVFNEDGTPSSAWRVARKLVSLSNSLNTSDSEQYERRLMHLQRSFDELLAQLLQAFGGLQGEELEVIAGLNAYELLYLNHWEQTGPDETSWKVSRLRSDAFDPPPDDPTAAPRFVRSPFIRDLQHIAALPSLSFAIFAVDDKLPLEIWSHEAASPVLLQQQDCLQIGPEEYRWKLRRLRSNSFDPSKEEQQGENGAPDASHSLFVRDPRRNRILPLLPFAIFALHRIVPRDGRRYRDDFFYYEIHKNGKMTYLGLRDDEEIEGIPSEDRRISLPFYVDIITSMKQEARIPPDEPIDWTRLVKRCNALTQDQLQVYYADKYDPRVYVPRMSIQSHWEEFLKNEDIGFLVVGDSGTGKTNFLCSEAHRLIDAGEAVLLYNCADSRDQQPDLEQDLQKYLHLGVTIFEQFQRLASERNNRPNVTLFLFLDALNEAKNPLKLMDSIVNFAREYSLLESPGVHVKLVVTCRTESWGRLRSEFRGDRYFYQDGSERAIRLERFEVSELEAVYGKYKERYDLHTAYADLPELVRSFIRDPFMMRLVSISFRGQVLDRVLSRRQVYENYIGAKIGYLYQEKRRVEHIEEGEIVDRFVAKMKILGREELDIQDDILEEEDYLLQDERLYQAIINPTITSPYVQLRDKGVLTAFGPRDAADREPRKVKFTYDRVFEYLLQRKIWPTALSEKDLDGVRSEIDESSQFPSLWGAVLIALQMYFEEHEDNPVVLTKLVESGNARVRAMMADMLVEYGLSKPKPVEAFVRKILLPHPSEDVARIGVQTAYELGLRYSLGDGLLSSSDTVRQMSTQYVFYLWQRAPQRGAEVIQDLYKKIEEQWKNLVPAVLRNAFRGKRGRDFIDGLGPFIDLTFLFLGYAYMGEEVIREVGYVWSDFVDLIPRGAMSAPVGFLLKQQVAPIIIHGLAEAPDYGANALRVIFDYDSSNPLRSCLADFAGYLDPKIPIPPQVLDQMFSVAQAKVATPMFFIAMIFYARAKLPERVDTFAFCRRLYQEGNVYSKNLALRIAGLLVYLEDLGGEELQFVEEMLLELWTGEETTYVYPVKDSSTAAPRDKTFHVGYLQFPVIQECRTRTGGASEFIERIMALPWKGDTDERIMRIITCLEDGVRLAASTRYTNVAPMLATISQWSAHTNLSVQDRLVQFLCLTRNYYPEQVDRFLDSMMDDLRGHDDDSAKRTRDLVRHVRESFEQQTLGRWLTTSGISEVPWLMQRSPTFVQLFSELLVKCAASKRTSWDDAVAELAGKVSSLEMLDEIARLMSGRAR
jgi:hypothetical protein